MNIIQYGVVLLSNYKTVNFCSLFRCIPVFFFSEKLCSHSIKSCSCYGMTNRVDVTVVGIKVSTFRTWKRMINNVNIRCRNLHIDTENGEKCSRCDTLAENVSKSLLIIKPQFLQCWCLLSCGMIMKYVEKPMLTMIE